MHSFHDKGAAGLFGRRCGVGHHAMQDVALRGVDIQANVVDMCAEVQVSQRYQNHYSYPIEAQYLFPLDSHAAVTGFESDIDGVVTKAAIQEKVQARQTYDAALARGDSAQLLEQKRDDVFQMSIGNLSPGSTCVIRIKYVTDLKVEGDAVVFFLPTHVAPRYTPASDKDPLPAGQGPRWVHDGLHVHVVAAMATNITSVDYETGGIPMTINGQNNVRTAVLGDGMQYLTQDIVVKVATENPHQPRCLVEKNIDGNTHCAVVTLAPHLDFDDCKCELVFIVDRSGSMSGHNISQATKAMQLFLRSVPEDCYFNIVGFGSRYEFLWPQSVRYGEETLAKASRHVANMAANLGGTEILEPLQKVLSSNTVEGYNRQVFLLTDGQVSNTEAVVRMVGKYAVKARTFALGLGSGASHALVEGVARAGNGTSAFVMTDGLESNVIMQLKRALQPALSDVTIEWEGAIGAPPAYGAPSSSDASAQPAGETRASDGDAPASVFGAFAPSAVGSLLNFSARTTATPPNPAVVEGYARAPFNTPPIFTGERFLSYCLVEAQGVAPSAVHITAKTPVGDLDVRLPVNAADMVQGSVVHAMAARALIQDLEDGRSWLGAAARVGDKTKAEITRLGLKFGLASKHTSYVAVQHSRQEERLHDLLNGGFIDQQSQSLAQSAKYFKGSAKKKSAGGMLSSLFGRGGGRGGAGGRASGSGRSMWSRSRAAPSAPSAPRPVAAPACAMKSDYFSAPPLSESRSMRREAVDSIESDDDDDWDEEGCDGGAAMESSVPSTMLAEKEDMCLPEPKSKRKSSSAPHHAKTSVAKPKRSDTACLQALVALQEFSGCFMLNQKLADLTGASVVTMETKAAHLATEYGVSGDTARQIVATAVAVAYMRQSLASLRDEWELIDTKALRWLAKQSGTHDDCVQVVGLPLVHAC